MIKRMKLRPWQPGDEPSLVQNANNRKVSVHLRDRFPNPYTVKDAEQWVRFTLTEHPLANLAIDLDGQAVGGVGLHLGADVFRFSAEIGYWLGEPYWGQGLATEAVKDMTDYAFKTFGLVRIFAGVFDSNPASARVLEKAGYTLESRMIKTVFKEGRFMDQLLYVKLK